MKWRENFIMKALAFMAAVAALTATAILTWYQFANFDALWNSGDGVGGYTQRYLLRRDRVQVTYLVDLKEMDAAGKELPLAARRDLEQLETEFDAGATNLRWQLLDADGKIIYGNTLEDSSRVEVDYWEDYNREWMQDLDPDPTSFAESAETPNPTVKDASLVLWVDDALRVDDQYREAARQLEQWQAAREDYLALALILGTSGILLAVYLCCGAGHKKGVDGIYLNWFHRLPGDVLLFAMFLAAVAAVGFGISIVIDSYLYVHIYTNLLVVGLGTAAAAALSLGALVTVCARCKAHTLLRNTLLWRLCGWCWRIFLVLWGALCGLFDTTGQAIQAVPLVWKAVMGCMAYMMFTFWIIASWRYYESGALLLWLTVTALASLYLCTWAYQWKRIRRATQEIIGGNPDCHIDTRRMLPDLRGHADELNNLGHAVSAAVEDRMRSEHFKAELITNVSHDLKTPLTSIINYVDLLKKADIADPKAREYIEVLDRKSQRLKKLTEDLVEASKASTGSLPVNWERLDFKQLADQALAECGERLQAQGLTVVRTLPEEPVWVDADGRHLWRVLDNLLTNCAKYALPGTRVYVDLRESGGRAVLSVKNISRDALDLPAERLMERFVRGDESRNASGSGLGLSIAQSLTELQHGQFSISIDGDLFKAVVSLPLTGNGPTSFVPFS